MLRLHDLDMNLKHILGENTFSKNTDLKKMTCVTFQLLDFRYYGSNTGFVLYNYITKYIHFKYQMI